MSKCIKIINMAIVKSIVEKVMYITIDNKEKLNSLEPADWNIMTSYLKEYEIGEERFLVIRGSGDNFSTGAQLSQDTVALVEDLSVLAKTLWHLSKPVIAVVDGLIVGAAANLALMCDFIICSDETKFIEIFSKRGLVIDFGGGWLLPKLVGFQNANKLSLLSETIHSQELLDLGLVYKSVKRTELNNELETLLNSLSSVSYNSICEMKKMIRNGMEMTMNEYLDLEHGVQLKTFEHPDAIEGTMSFLEKRKPDFK